MRKGVLASVVFLCLLVCIHQDAFAQQTMTGGKITVGRLRVVPGLTLQEVYDDNIFLANGRNDVTERKVDDWITHVMPNALVNYTLEGRGSITAGYLGDYAYYKDNDSNDWKNHQGILSADYEGPGGLVLGLDNTYIDASDPFGSENQFNLGQKTKRWNDLLGTRFGYRFSDRFKVLGYYNYYKQDYDLLQDFSQDYDSNEVGAGFQVKFLPRTWGFFRYYYGERDYYTHPEGFGVTDINDADYNWHRVNVGLTWDPGAKLKGEVNFGYQWRQYENTFDPQGASYENKDTWIAGTRVTYTATATTTLSLTILRALRETGSNSNEFFEDTGGSIGIIQALHYRLNLFANVGYSKNEYNLPVDNARSQDNYLGNVGIEYRLLEWLAATASYTYNRKDSNFPDDEYTVNQFLVGLRALY